MIQIKDKEKAARLRRELAAELSKPQINSAEVQRIRNEILKAGFRCGTQPTNV